MDLDEARGLDGAEGATGSGSVSSFHRMDASHSRRRYDYPERPVLPDFNCKRLISCLFSIDREQEGIIMTGELFVGSVPCDDQVWLSGIPCTYL